MRHYKNRNNKKIAVLFFALIFILTLAAPTLAQTVEDVVTPTPEYSALETSIVEINEKILALEQNIKTSEQELETLKQQQSEIQGELEKVTTESQNQQEISDERLRAEYMVSDSDSDLDNLLTQDETASEITDEKVTADIIAADQDKTAELTETIQTLQVQLQQVLDQLNAKQEDKTRLESELQSASNEKTEKEAQLVQEREKGIEHADTAEDEEAVADGLKVIREVSAQSEAQTLNSVKDQTSQKQAQAKQATTDTLNSIEQVKSDYSQSDDQTVNDLVAKASELGESIESEQQKVDQAAQETQEAPTAADAVKAQEPIDSGLVVVLDQVASAQEVVSQLKTVDLDKKKQEAVEAAEKAREKREAAVQKGQDEALKTAEEAEAERQKQIEEAARKAAEEAAKKAEEARQKEEEERKKAEEEAKQKEEEQQQQANSGPLPSDYISTTGWRWPLDGIYEITSVFGYRVHPIFGDGRGHEGIDIAASTGTPVHSCDGGTVILAGENGGYGNCIIVQQNSGHQVYYGHLSQIGVSVGQTVSKGEVIGQVGSTGWSTGPHLHLGVLSGDSFVDPFTYFPEVDHMSSN